MKTLDWHREKGEQEGLETQQELSGENLEEHLAEVREDLEEMLKWTSERAKEQAAYLQGYLSHR